MSGYDINGQNDVLYLDYLYFIVNYSIPNVIINEVMFDPAGPDNNSEWVELYNAGAFSVDLTGWALADNHGNSYALVIDKPILELLRVTPDTPFEIITDGRCLVLAPVRDPEEEQKFREALDDVHQRFGRAMKRLAK